MKQFIANLLISATGRILFPIVLALVSAGVAWVGEKIPFIAGMLQPHQIAVVIMATLMTFALWAIHKTTGGHVKFLQKWLNDQGYSLREDGWFGDKTADALSAATDLPVSPAIPVRKPDAKS